MDTKKPRPPAPAGNLGYPLEPDEATRMLFEVEDRINELEGLIHESQAAMREAQFRMDRFLRSGGDEDGQVFRNLKKALKSLRTNLSKGQAERDQLELARKMYLATHQ